MNTQITSILWYLSWPLLIFLSYKLIRFILKIYEKKISEKEDTVN